MLSASTTRRARRGMVREWRLHTLSLFSLSVAFVCLGAVLLVVTNFWAAEQRWRRAGRASVFLKDSASQGEVDALRAALVRVPGVTGVRYVSSGDARTEFGRESDGKGDLAALPIEAFPASIELDVAPDMPDADLADMVVKMRQIPAVDDVETYQAWTGRLTRLARGGVAAAGVLAIAVRNPNDPGGGCQRPAAQNPGAVGPGARGVL